MASKIRPNFNQRGAIIPVDDEIESVITSNYVFDSITGEWVAQTQAPSSVTITGEVEVKNDTGNPLPVSGPLTDTQLRATAPSVKDDYQTGETLEDQTGAGAVLTFTFSAAVNLIVIDCNGAITDICRADPFGGTPTATKGVVCRDEVPTYIPVVASSVKIFAPTGVIVSVYGLRRT